MREHSKITSAIAAFAELTPRRYPDKTPFEMFSDLLSDFFSEWSIEKELIDGLFMTPPGMAAGHADIFAHQAWYDSLGIHPSFSRTINAGGAAYPMMIRDASMLIETGQAEAILCVGVGKFPKVGGGGADSAARMVSHEEFEYIYGTFIPAMYAMTATRHMHDYGTTSEDLAQVAISNREWALKNPEAIMHEKGSLTTEMVLESRMIAEPFHLLDCSVPCEGGGVVLVTSEEIARKISDQPAYIQGIGEHHSHGYISQAPNFSKMAPTISGKKAYEMAGLTPKDIQVAEIYDSFTINPIMYVEDLGFVPKGEGANFFKEGRGKPGGDLPINTNGGLLSYGHNGDSSGLSVVIEGIAQTMGKAKERQVQGIEHVLVHTYGGMMCEHATMILGRESR